ncbi:60S ribosomal export protein NMD3, partial [Caerostris extrusa]
KSYERIKFAGQGRISQKHVLSDVWVVRSSELGLTESFMHSRTHLGHLLKPGDSVLGSLQTIKTQNFMHHFFSANSEELILRGCKHVCLKSLLYTYWLELSTININDTEYNKIKKENLPDVILIKKIYEDKMSRRRRRKWKLKHLDIDAETDTTSVIEDFDDFLEDLEEDVEYRQNVNIYKERPSGHRSGLWYHRLQVRILVVAWMFVSDKDKLAIDSDDVSDSGVPQITLQDMMDELVIGGDATGEEGASMLE